FNRNSRSFPNPLHLSSFSTLTHLEHSRSLSLSLSLPELLMATCIRKPPSNPEPQLQTPRARSPLSENLSPSTITFPRSPLSFISPHSLSPLKLSSPKLVTPTSLRADDDDDEDDMSISSGSDAVGVGGGVNELLSDYDLDDDEVVRRYYDEEEVFGPTKPSSKLNRGALNDKNLRIEVPIANRRVTDGESRLRRFAMANSTPGSYLRDERPHTLSSKGSVYWDSNEDMGTPSAPPIMDIGEDDNIVELEKEIEQIEDEICREAGVESHHQQVNIGCIAGDTVSHLYPEFSGSVRETQTEEAEQIEDISSDQLNCHSISGQYAWQSLLAYDACVRLCLYAWSRGSSEAPEFLRDECRLLRGAFGLHKFLLQPRGVRSTEESKNVKVEQKTPLKSKNVVRKLRVEVKRLRLIPQRKLRGIDSLRSLMSTPMGAEYCRQVSSLVKTGMSSIKTATLSAVSEEQFSCYLQMKSTAEGDQVQQGSSVCLQSGTGSYHVFFPEPEGDALLIEVHDKKKSVQGKVTIPMASLTDNPNENVRWWPIYHGEQDCVGKIQLFLGSTTSSDEDCHIKSAPVVETLAYDLLLEAATRAQRFHAQNLRLNGSWKWLLSEFAEYYGVSDSYTKLRYLSHVMNVATPTKTCLQLVHELLVPILSARSDKSLTRQEKSMLMDCEIEIEKLLANVFENYKSLDESCPSGLAHISGPVQESASTALAPAVQIFCLLHDILSPEGQEILKNYLKTAAKKRCRNHMAETDEYVSSNSEGFLLDSVTISTAYHKMKNLCLNISSEIETDIKITNEHVLPSSIDLSNIAAAVYSTLLCNRLRAFLSAVPPSCPQPHVNELLIAVSDFERSLDSWGISPVQGGIDSRGLFHNYIMVWIHDMELRLLDRCKAEKVPWSGVITNHSTSPFAEDMYERIKDSLMEYEVVISRWPQYTLILENTASIVERAIVKSLEKQYSDILTPLKDSIPKRLNMHVQKLTRRQSSALYSVPTQLGTFVNTIKRILDVLHQRVEDILRQWASCLPVVEDKKSLFGEQMNVITVLLRTKYRNYMQAAVDKLVSNTQSNKTTRLKRILEEIRENEREVEVRERMRMLCSQITDSISNMHDVFTSQIFVASCRLFWDRMAQVVLKFLEGRKENEVGYKGSYYALGIVEDTFASEMQRLQGNSLQEKDMEAPRSVIEARSILSRDTTNHSSYFYV
uniref:MHD1 domain-containing protein n=2 Tax=Brassica oleracea var. oleracea TaxID=109376 RepID=A0A0D3DBR4_BRAOL